MYKCDTCGADLVYDPNCEKLLCVYCKRQIEIEKAKYYKYAQDKKVVESTEDGESYSVLVHKCSRCGGELYSTNNTISTFCSYCGSSETIESRVSEQKKPDYIIPFKFRKKVCKEEYIKLISKAFYAPKDMRETQVVDKVRGIYMPYDIYVYEKHGLQSNYGEVYSHTSGDYKYYDKYNITCEIDAEMKGFAHDTAKEFFDNLSEGIAPFKFNEAKPFSPAYLGGYYADGEDVSDDQKYIEDSKKMASELGGNQLRSDKAFRKYGCIHPKVDMNYKEKKKALYPVYFLSTRNKTGDRISYAVMNGQTGRIAAEIPLDQKKFAIITLLSALPIFFLLNLFVVLTPITISWVSIVLGFLCILLADKQNVKIFKKEFYLDDYGFQGKSEAKLKISFGKRFMKLLLPIISILISGLILLINPVSDWYYYGGALTSVIFILITMIKLISSYNLLTSRKLPQFEERGGNRSAL